MEPLILKEPNSNPEFWFWKIYTQLLNSYNPSNLRIIVKLLLLPMIFPIKNFHVKSSLFLCCIYVLPHYISRLCWGSTVQSLVAKNHHHKSDDLNRKKGTLQRISCSCLNATGDWCHHPKSPITYLVLTLMLCAADFFQFISQLQPIPTRFFILFHFKNRSPTRGVNTMIMLCIISDSMLQVKVQIYLY